MLNLEELKNCCLDDWVTEFNDIYWKINSRRSAPTIWLHVVEHAASIHEDLRTVDYAGALRHLPRLYCWLCAFVTSAKSDNNLLTNESLKDIVLSKFPEQCFYCGEKRCICQSAYGAAIQDTSDKKLKKKERRKIAISVKKNLKNPPDSLPQFVEMFNKIFGAKNFDNPIEIIVAHLQEEIGEVAEDMNKLNDIKKLGYDLDVSHQDLEEEIADVFAWTVALHWKLDYILGNTSKYFNKDRRSTLNLGLPEIIWNVYRDEKTRSYMVDPVTQTRPVEPPKSI